MNVREYERLKQEAEDAVRHAERAEGAYATVLNDLCLKYDVNTVAEAEKLLARMKKELAKLEKDAEEKAEAFEAHARRVEDAER